MSYPIHISHAGPWDYLDVAGKGTLPTRLNIGIFILRRKGALLSCVFGHGPLVHRRALWVGLELEGSCVGILNVYVPTYMQQRTAFWQAIVEMLAEKDSWIVGGDFNNLATQED